MASVAASLPKGNMPKWSICSISYNHVLSWIHWHQHLLYFLNLSEIHLTVSFPVSSSLDLFFRVLLAFYSYHSTLMSSGDFKCDFRNISSICVFCQSHCWAVGSYLNASQPSSLVFTSWASQIHCVQNKTHDFNLIKSVSPFGSPMSHLRKPSLIKLPETLLLCYFFSNMINYK